MSGVLDVLAMSVVSLLGALWAYRLAAKFDHSASIAERALSFQAFTRSQRRWQSRFGYSGPMPSEASNRSEDGRRQGGMNG